MKITYKNWSKRDRALYFKFVYFCKRNGLRIGDLNKRAFLKGLDIFLNCKNEDLIKELLIKNRD